MKPLKEATYDKHKEAERMLFNVKMFKGELDVHQYAKYLQSQLAIFTAIEENFELPNEGLKRVSAVNRDLISLGYLKYNLENIDPATQNYVDHIKSLDNDTAMAHVYLNYLAIMFGGQMMKKNTPGDGNMYEFENMMECAGSVRAIQKDEWADEVNKGFDFMIEIFKELEKTL